MAILWEWKNLMFFQGTLYHHHTLAGELEEDMQFVVSKAHQIAAMNWCHREDGHQGQQQILYLLQDWFWCPAWLCRCRKWLATVNNASHMKAPMPKHDAAHHCHCSFETPTHRLYMYWYHHETGSAPKHGECDHFMKHVMVCVAPDQTAKTVVRFLWQGYILIFNLGNASLLSDWGTNFESNMIKELCEFMGIWKVKTSTLQHSDQWTNWVRSPDTYVHDRETK